MLLNGRKISQPKIELIVIPRNGADDIILKAQAIRSVESFNKLCPTPRPPSMVKRGVGVVENVEDPKYKQALISHNQKRLDWLVIESLKATEDLEWETVKYDDPNTWHLYTKELQDSGFGEYEINRIVNGVMIANCLDDDKIEEARKSFLASQLVALDHSSSHNTGQSNGSSGDVVNVST